MPKKYGKSDNALFVRKVMLGMKGMKAELDEHRYRLEQNVERRTEQLQKRIALLESCNATLSSKLAAAHRELAALKRPHVLPKEDAEPEDRVVKLRVMNNQTQITAGSGVRDEWGGHAAA